MPGLTRYLSHLVDDALVSAGWYALQSAPSLPHIERRVNMRQHSGLRTVQEGPSLQLHRDPTR